ncbi:hypothetical protein [Xanthomonas vesicatoria]|uniref:hypothetical protein n=2 Tax=Xanthomonas vesicatoria TaxID=56460 RepID=UPI001E5B2FA6|nr:hypothetical protein [Xanthomonas vesicatoria]MCC8630776.1 hypothetical protein [Xanthomonas vesicatoria]
MITTNPMKGRLGVNDIGLAMRRQARRFQAESIVLNHDGIVSGSGLEHPNAMKFRPLQKACSAGLLSVLT